jgi:tungstate transport system ATP-binding protein
MGPNGSGKTLLLKSCAGLLPASKGRVIWQTTPNPPIITWVPQSAVLLNRSVIENIYRLLKHQGSLEDKKIRLRRCEEALAWVGIGHLKQQNALTLSTGERQLLALARAWALSPKILLLDEPSANLDPMRQTQMNSLIRALSERCKIIFSTHSVSQARELATDVLLLKQGRLLTHCNAATFFDSEYSRMTDSLCLS